LFNATRAAAVKIDGTRARRAPVSEGQWYADAIRGGSAEPLLSVEIISRRQRQSRWRGALRSVESRIRVGIREQVVRDASAGCKRHYVGVCCSGREASGADVHLVLDRKRA
jgi:hypothetical protein